MNIATTVLIVLNVIFALCVILGFIWGLKRGVKKSAVRITSIAICLILAYFIAIPLTSAVMTMDISGIVNQQGSDGQSLNTLHDVIINVITSNETVADAYNNSESLQALIDALPKMLMQCFVFVILFWLFKFISWIVYAIIVKALWGKKKKSKSAKTQEKQKNQTVQNGRVVENGNVRPIKDKPIKQHRLAGAAVGTLQGLVIAFFTMIPLAGVASIISEIDKSTSAISQTYNVQDSTNNDENQLEPLGDILREMLGNEVVDALKVYDESALGIICGWTGIDDLAFDVQSSAKIGDTRTYLRKELISLVNAYDQAQQIKSFDLSTLDFDTLQKLCDYLFSSNALMSVANDLIPYYVEKIINDPDTNIDADIKSFLTLYLDSYGTPTIEELKQDLNCIITAMKVVQENDVFAIIQDEEFSIDRLIDVLEDDGEKTPIKDIVVTLSGSNTIQKVLQVGVNYALDYLSTELTKVQGSTITIEHANFDDIYWNEINEELPTIINNLFVLYRQYNVEGSTTDKIGNVDFVNIGRTLDLLTSSSLLKEALENTTVALNQVDAYNKYIDFSVLTNEIDYVQEFTYIQSVVDALNTVDALSFFTDSTISAQEFLERLGQNINENQTCIDIVAENLTSSEILKAAISRSLNVFYEEYIQPDIDFTIDKINQSNIVWEQEKEALTTIINFVSANADYFLNDISVENIIKNVDLEGLGISLDVMKNSELLYPIYKVGIQYAKDNEEINKYINSDAINLDTNWTEEMLNLKQALDVAKSAGIIDAMFEDDGISQVLDIINSDTTIIENIVDHLFDSKIMQYSVENLINQLQNIIGDTLDITITATYVDIQYFIDNLDNKKLEFSDIINNIAVVASPIMKDSFNLDVLADNIDAFALAFTAIQESEEFHNTYMGIVEYIAQNESINVVVDFSIVGDNFDFITEFNTIEEIITILKNNDAWTPLVDSSMTVDEVVDTLDADTKSQITELILESKLFNGLAVDSLNDMIDEFNGYLNTNIAHIPAGTDLSSQSSNIATITKYLLELNNSGMTDIILNQLDMTKFGNLLTALKDNKFVYSGALTEVYEALVDFMTDDENYGYLILDACQYYGDTVLPNQNIDLNWSEITAAFDELLNMESSLNDIANLQASDIITVLTQIGESQNALVERITKTFLKHDKTEQNALKIDNFDFTDTEFNSQAINILYNLKDVTDALSSDISTGLDSLKLALSDLSSLDRTKLDTLVQFIDATTESDFYETINGVDFESEAEIVDKFKAILNLGDPMTINMITQSISDFSNSTLVLNELYKNNIVICDIKSDTIMNELKESIASDSEEYINPENITDEQVIEVVQNLVNDIADADKQEKILSILNLT